MKYNVGDRWVWRDSEVSLIGYISELKPGNNKTFYHFPI